jgi:hypothetical protein
VCEADLTTICEPIFNRKCGSLNDSPPYGPPRPVTGMNGIKSHFNPGEFHNQRIKYILNKKMAL